MDSGGAPKILCLPGPKYRNDFDSGIIISNERIFIHEEGGMGRGTAWSVWDGGMVVAKYLERLCLTKHNGSPAVDFSSAAAGGNRIDPNIHLSFSSILELGSGTGLAGIAAAATFQNTRVMLTDLDIALPALRHNVSLNRQAIGDRVSVKECDWENPSEDFLKCPYDCIIAADCVWLEHLVKPFVSTMRKVLDYNPMATGLLAYQSRTKRVDTLLFSQFLEAGIRAEKAPLLPGEPPRGKIDLYCLLKKPTG